MDRFVSVLVNIYLNCYQHMHATYQLIMPLINLSCHLSTCHATYQLIMPLINLSCHLSTCHATYQLKHIAHGIKQHSLIPHSFFSMWYMTMVLWIVMETFLVFRKIKEKTLLKLNKKLQLIEVKCTMQFEESINEKLKCFYLIKLMVIYINYIITGISCFLEQSQC
jgi:hypothetical protein